MEKDFLHLCQPDPGKSCGACCGLYNYARSARGDLERRLRLRTEQFRRLVRTESELSAFAAWSAATEDQTKRYEVIHCCEYLGFLDSRECRVGCLLHPLRHGGADWRDNSFYGRELCAGHLCPSYHFLSHAEQEALIIVLDDWFLYGLCLTDIDFVKAYFRLLGDAIGRTPTAAAFREPVLRSAARAFFDLKVAWPFRSEAVNRFGRYYFDGSRYMIRLIDYDALGAPRSRFDPIFLSLGSEFVDRATLLQAEALVGEMIERSVRAYEYPVPVGASPAESGPLNRGKMGN